MTNKVERALAQELALEAAASPRARHARAVSLCREALRHDGNCVEAYRTLAALLAQEGKSSEAANAQARADRLAEENRALSARSDLAAAQEAVRLNPRAEVARRRLASMYELRGEYGAAVREYRAVRVLLTDPWQREQIDQTIRMLQQRADRTAGR